MVYVCDIFKIMKIDWLTLSVYAIAFLVFSLYLISYIHSKIGVIEPTGKKKFILNLINVALGTVFGCCFVFVWIVFGIGMSDNKNIYWLIFTAISISVAYIKYSYIK